MTVGASQAVLRTSADRLSERNFKRLSAYIYDYSGIKMPPSKLTMLEGRLRRRLRITGYPTFDSYCGFLFDNGGLQQESVYLIDVVTTNKTDFFREPNHFDFLRDQALPTLTSAGVRSVNAWSAACSIGAEPYTMAMVLENYRADTSGFDYTILASDLSTDVLQKARRGVYSADMLRPVPTEMKRRYVMQSKDPQREEMRISPDLRRKVGFARINLMDDQYPIREKLHLIFCRNVLIYFDKPTQMHVLTRLSNALVPGGYLFIGHSGSIGAMSLPVRQVANTVFTKG